MGELSGDAVQQQKISGDHEVSTSKGEEGAEQKGIPTDVEGVFADGEKGGEPVFDVSSTEFFNNMKLDRRKIRFANGSPAQQYRTNSKYRRPFWIRNKDDGYMRRIK